MNRWPDKYVIGLTGNIATGKSVVRKMLEHLGAYGIDADALSHRAIAKGAPGYQPAIDSFGKWILKPDGEIDRARLGRVVFNDPEAMQRLEAIIHPLVQQAIDLMVRRSTQRVIVIEAIKLLEGNLRGMCSSIWVVSVPPEMQIQRLIEKRALSREDAAQRVNFQGSAQQKIDAAHVVIQNNGSYEDTWKRVLAEWKIIAPAAEPAPQPVPTAQGSFSIARGRPRDSLQIAQLITRLGGIATSQDEIMAAFGEKAFMLLQMGGKSVGVAGWQVENLVARTTEFYIDPSVDLEKGLAVLMSEVERASLDLQCEASILYLPKALAGLHATWKQLGYEPRAANSLGVQAWTDAANESVRPHTQLFFKQLRLDRVLRPI
jgi:dephospho-CoA kinase